MHLNPKISQILTFSARHRPRSPPRCRAQMARRELIEDGSQ